MGPRHRRRVALALVVFTTAGLILASAHAHSTRLGPGPSSDTFAGAAAASLSCPACALNHGGFRLSSVVAIEGAPRRPVAAFCSGPQRAELGPDRSVRASRAPPAAPKT